MMALYNDPKGNDVLKPMSENPITGNLASSGVTKR